MTSERPTADSLPREPMARLLAVMAWLRDRHHGCPWDIDQTFRTIAPYTIEEAYEVADAIDRDDMTALKEELGDLLLQVVYHAQMASEAKAFGFADVAAAIADKMVDRHPHVFGDTWIANWCRAHGIMWTGVDLNPSFCARAKRLGHHVIEGDLFTIEPPCADVYLMAGSLYHFHDRVSTLFDVVWGRTNRFILSEPVQNLSARRDVLGWIARRSTNPGNAHASFRYDERTLIDVLARERDRCGSQFQVASAARDMLVVIRKPQAPRSERELC